MPAKEPDVIKYPTDSARTEAGQGTAAPTAEETAAIVAVLALVQAEEPKVEDSPRPSSWARAGRRDAVRPWTKQG